MVSLPVLVSGLVLLYTVYLYLKYYVYAYWRKKSVVFEEPTILFGNMLPTALGKMHLGEYYTELYEKYKGHRYFGTYAFLKPVLVVTDPELIKMVLTREFAHFQNRNFFNDEKIDPMLGHLFFLNDEKWKNLRVKLNPTFSTGKIRLNFDIVKNAGDQLKTCFENLHGKDVDVTAVIARFTTDVIMQVAFGTKTDCLQNPDGNSAIIYWSKKIFEQKPIKNVLLVFAPKIMEILKMPFIDVKVRDFFTSIFMETIEMRSKEKVSKPRDFLDFLMQLLYLGNDQDNVEKINDEGKLTITQGVAQAFVFFLGGYETSSTTSGFCLCELAKNVDVQEKLRSEIISVLEKHDGNLTYENLNEMTYLSKVINETLRKYPQFLMLNRVCTKAIDLPTTNLHVEKGTDVFIPVLGLHKDPEIWPDPEKFDPERFSEENVASRHPYYYLPFGEGQRICIGMRFGLMQTKVAIISALTACRFEISPDTEFPLKIHPGRFLFSTQSPIKLKLSPLTKN